MVEWSVHVLGGHDAEWDADDDGEQHRRERQFQGGGEAFAQLVDDRPLCRDAQPEVTRGDPLEVLPVLHDERPVEAVLALDGGHGLWRRSFAEERLGRAARKRSGPREHEERDGEEDRYGEEQPSCRVARHAVRPLLLDRHGGEVLRGHRTGDEALDVRAERQVGRRMGEGNSWEEVHDRSIDLLVGGGALVDDR